MACRATDDAATASGPLRRRRRAARGAARRLEASRRAATASAGRRESPDRPPPARGPRRRRSRNFTSRARHPAPTRSEFTQIRKNKRAPTTSDRHDARRYHDDGVEAEGADFDAGFWPERLLFAPARDDVITKTPSTRCQVQVQCPRRVGAWRSAISTNLRCSWPPLASSLSSSATRLRKISTLLSFSARIVLAREDRLV